MRALETNVLVYAQMAASEFHERAVAVLHDLTSGSEPWALPWPCVYEYLRVVTHPHATRQPVRFAAAWRDLTSLLAAPNLMLLAETERHPAILESVVRQSGAVGNLIHDAHIAALCLEHGVSEFITGDRDFARFHGLRLHNPFAELPSPG